MKEERREERERRFRTTRTFGWHPPSSSPFSNSPYFFLPLSSFFPFSFPLFLPPYSSRPEDKRKEGSPQVATFFLSSVLSARDAIRTFPQRYEYDLSVNRKKRKARFFLFVFGVRSLAPDFFYGKLRDVVDRTLLIGAFSLLFPLFITRTFLRKNFFSSGRRQGMTPRIEA